MTDLPRLRMFAGPNGSGKSTIKSVIRSELLGIYPDVSVSCDERDRSATKFISYPCTIVEVLSPSTRAYDRWEKFNLYRRFSTGEATPTDVLQDYVLVDTDRVEVALYSKNDRGKWEINRYIVGDLVELKSINLTFPIEQIFEGIVFSPGLEC